MSVSPTPPIHLPVPRTPLALRNCGCCTSFKAHSCPNPCRHRSSTLSQHRLTVPPCFQVPEAVEPVPYAPPEEDTRQSRVYAPRVDHWAAEKGWRPRKWAKVSVPTDTLLKGTCTLKQWAPGMF